MSKRSGTHDCIIVGAGMSGLACARELNDKGLDVVVLEARDRVGGRVFTKRDPTSNLPVELGAEFIHGTNPSIMDRAQEMGLTFYDCLDKHDWLGEDGLTSTDDYFEEMSAVLNKLDAKRKKDRSFAEFLQAHTSISPKIRALVKAFVEGYHAADLERIGERGLAISEQASEAARSLGPDSAIFRWLDGYDRLAMGMMKCLPSEALHLNTVVKRVEWDIERVIAKAYSPLGHELGPYRSKAIVISVPLGVLQARESAPAAISFAPEPDGFREALSGLHMGHAMRITFRFKSRFWEEDRKEPIGYLHAGPEFDFPTWWTQMPLRTPLLVAWQGGPRCVELARLPETDRVSAALDTLANLLSIDVQEIREELVGWHTHDWSNDPYTLGAYSYLGVDGDKVARRLLTSWDDTLFFAGEATIFDGERGTVDGAIDTGLRTAGQVLKALGVTASPRAGKSSTVRHKSP